MKTYLRLMLPPGGRNWQLICPNFYICYVPLAKNDLNMLSKWTLVLTFAVTNDTDVQLTLVLKKWATFKYRFELWQPDISKKEQMWVLQKLLTVFNVGCSIVSTSLLLYIDINMRRQVIVLLTDLGSTCLQQLPSTSNFYLVQ